MKVLFCITGLEKGGAEKMVTLLAINGKEQYTGMVVSVFGGWYEKELRNAGVAVDVLIPHVDLVNIVALPLRFLTLVKKCHKDVSCIHAFLPLAGWLGMVLKFCTRIPLVYCICSSPKFLSPRRNLLRYFLHLWAYAAADSVAVNAPVYLPLFTKKTVGLLCPAVSKPFPAACVDLTIKNDFFSHQDIFTVVTICSMRPPRDLETLMQVAKRCPDTQFVLVGSGPLLHFVRKEVSRHSLSNVRIAGFHANIWPFLASAQASMLLTHHEGFPNTILEAMVMQVPVIVSDIPEIRHTLKDDECCWYVKNHDVDAIISAISSIKNSTAERLHRVQKAVQVVTTRFSIENLVARNKEMCAAVIAHSCL